jgi:hypothetical protein
VAGATFQCRVDGGAWAACGSTTTLASLADGPHTLLVRSVAPDGTVDPEPASQAWTLATPPPGPFSLLAPGDGAATSDSTPTLSWEPSSNADHYVVHLGGGSFETDATQYTPPAALADGAHEWHVDAVDANGRTRSSGGRTFTVDTAGPAASLHASPNPALTGGTVTLDASGSSDPGGGAIVRHEWDLDGDGSFERDTGAASSTTATYPSRREIAPAVRVTDRVGHTASASVALSVRQAPPAGPVGVSINDGARFTKDRRVTVHVVWPPFATSVLLSNDGGFRDAGTFPVEPEVPWTIDGLGSGRLPRTIYARFEGLAGRETYQDDIILDEGRPRVIVAEIAGVTKRTYRLRIKGRDALSGVKRMQVTTNTRKPGAILRYRNFTRLKATRQRPLVRVRDGAGNWSRWKRVER